MANIPFLNNAYFSAKVSIGAAGTNGVLSVEGTGASGVPVLDIINTTASTFNHSAEIMTPNMTTGQNNILVIGRVGSTKNSGYIGYKYSGTAASNDNLLTFGHWGSDNLMNINGVGNVGIGTTDPVAKLHVNNVNAEGTLQISRSGTNMVSGSATGSIVFPADYNGTPINYAKIVSYANALSSVRGSLDFKVKSTSGSLLTGLTLYGTSAGVNVGIGTISPGAKLEVNGQIVINSTALGGQDAFSIYNSTNQLFHIQNSSTNDEASLLLGANNVIKVKLDTAGDSYLNGGNVGIGETNPGYKLDVSGSSAAGFRLTTNGFTSLDLVSPRTSGNLGGLRFKQDIDTYQTSEFLGLHGGGFDWKTGDGSVSPSKKMSMLANGNVGIGTISPDNLLHLANASGNAILRMSGGGSLGDTYGGFIKGYGVAGQGGKLDIGVIDNSTFKTAIHIGSQSNEIEFSTAGVNRLNITNALATFSGDLTVNGGDIILGGTGRIQGIDTVSASTDAANKAYVDAAVAGVPTGDITGVTAGTFLTGGGTSGTVTLNADISKLGHIVNSSNGSVTAGWITVASASSARRQGEVYVTDGESGDHAFIRIDWLRSYADTNFTVLNCGGHSNRIVGVRVLQETSDATYGPKYLQVKVTVTSNYYVAVVAPGTIPNYTDLLAVTPVLENTKTGYAVTGAQLEDLDDSSVGTHEGLTVGEDLYVNGGGVVLGGTGRIQGVDTVSASTDAANKAYVDAHGGGVGPFLPLAGGTMTTTAKIQFYNASQYIHASSTNDLTIASGDDINYRANYSRFFNPFTGTEFARLSGASSSWIANGSNGKLGIGITAPLDTLHVDGGVVIQNGSNLQWGGVYSNGFPTIYASTDYIHFVPTGVTGASSRQMRLNATGLGIGTSSPGYKLHVNGNAYINSTLYVNGQATFDDQVNVTSGYSINFGTSRLHSTSTSYLLGGNVGIGTSNPGYKLDVSGNARFTSQTTHGGGLVTSSTQTRNKISVWSSLSTYTIGMKSGFGYGGLGGAGAGTDYAMSFQMSANDTRGWWWGDSVMTDVQGSMSLTTDGKLVIAKNISVGFGEDTTTGGVTNAVITALGNQTFGIPGGGTNTDSRYLSIEGNADGSGEGSGRIFFTEHNSTTASMDNYGMSLGYRGGSTSIVGASGTTWTGLTQIGNGQWGMWGHDNSGPGALIMSGDRAATYVEFHSNDIKGAGDIYVADQIIHTGDTNTYMQFHAADQWRVVTGGSERLEVNNTYTKVTSGNFVVNNNVGIGTTSPDSLLTIGGNGVSTLKPTVIFTDTTNGGSLVLRGQSPILAFDKTGTGVPKILMDTGGVQFKTGTLDAEGDIDMVILPDGNVGIGTSNPGYKLDVNGSLHSTNITLADGIYHEGDTNTYINFLSDTIQLATSGSVRAYINSSGNVGIGHTNPTGKLDIFRTSTTYAVNRGNTLDRAGLVIKSSGNFDSKITFSSGANSVQYIQALNNSATVGRDININPYGGNVITAGTMTATNFILSSDERLKENIKEVCDNRIKADWKTFELKIEKGQKRYGVIAQELEKTNPEFVREDTQGFKSVAYIDLLIAKIAELEARLEKLEK